MAGGLLGHAQASPSDEATPTPSADVPEMDATLVSAHTAGMISRRDPIVLQLTRERADAGEPGSAAPDGLFRFSPPVAGKAVWSSPRELRFEPAAELQAGTHYDVTVDL